MRNNSSCCHKHPSQQRFSPLPSHTTVARTDVLGAGVAVLGVEGLEAAAAVGSAVLHDVSLPPQHRLAFEAAEVLHVPVPPFSLGALIGKNDLRERNTNAEQSWSESRLGMWVPTFVSPAHAWQLCPCAHITSKFYS